MESEQQLQLCTAIDGVQLRTIYRGFWVVCSISYQSNPY